MTTDYNGYPSRAAALTALFRDAPHPDDPTKFREYAHALLDLGVALVLVPAGEKGARMKGWQTDPITDRQRFDRVYADGMNLGVHLGASQLVVVDADTPGEVATLRTWWTGSHDGAPLPPAAVHTPGSASKGHSDGGHWYFDTSHADVDTSSLSKLTNVAGVDGQKGFDVMTGRCYVLLPGCTRDDVADVDHRAYVADEKGTVHVLDFFGTGDPVRDLLDGRVRAARAKSATVTDVTTIDYTPGSRDHYLAQWWAATGWANMLALDPAGQWDVTGHADCGCEVWHRPGGVSPRSAIAHDVGCTRYRTDEQLPGMCFLSTGIHAVEVMLDAAGDGRRTLSCFDAYAALCHGGDRAAAAEAAGLPRIIGDLSQLGTNFDDAEFWNAHPVLSRIQTNARKWQVDPFTQFAADAVEVVGRISPVYVLDVPRVASLNLYAAVAARQGGGKGKTFDNARRSVTRVAGPGEQFDLGEVVEVNNFTGEGIAEFMQRPVDDDGNPTGYVRALIREDEAQNMFTRWARRDATIITTLNKMFMGEGFSAALAGGKRNYKVAPQSYRCGVLLGVQFRVARPLLTGEALDTGLTARFLYVDTRVHAGDRLPGDADRTPIVVDMSKIETDPVEGYDDLRAIRTEQSLVDHIAEVAGAANVVDDDTSLDDMDALDDWNGADGHRGLLKRKVATILAIMFGDPVVTWRHWHLAEYVVANSDRVRARLGRVSAYAAEQTETRKKVVENRDAKLADRLSKAAEWFADRLTTSPEGVPWSKLTADGPAKRKWPDEQVEQIRALLADGADERVKVVPGRRNRGWKVVSTD